MVLAMPIMQAHGKWDCLGGISNCSWVTRYSFFGAAGLVHGIEAAIKKIQQALPNGAYAFNLIIAR